MAVGLVVLFTVLAVRALVKESKQKNYPSIERIDVPPSAAQHLSRAIQIPTISNEESADFDSSAFRAYARFLSDVYPLADLYLGKKSFNDFSLLYRWQGKDTSLKPILLLSHYDVVPVEPATLNSWKNDPYSGALLRDTIWGRGAIDDKMAGIAILETFERLLQENFQPQRSIYLALGHDEERGGRKGAAAMAEYLSHQNTQFEFILDEGGALTQGIIPGVRKEVAVIGIAEKGFLNLELSASLAGGHSSIPLGTNSIDVLSAGLSRLRANPFPAKLSRPIKLFFDYLGPESSFVMKFALSNSDVLEPLLLKGLGQFPQGKANIRTTMVPTIFSSGIKGNVIPKTASATVNLRILPGESIASAIAYVKRTINDQRIKVKPEIGAAEPSEVSEVNSEEYETIYRTVREIFPKVVVVPHLVVGGTDSRYFTAMTDHIFRFRPLHVRPDNIQSFHGLNERMPVADLEDGIRFFYQLIKNSSS